MNIQELLGERIRQIRTAKGLTQEELAFLCETNASHIHRIEHNMHNTSFDVICRIAQGLQISLLDLLDFSKEVELPPYDSATMKTISYMHGLPMETRDQIVEIVKTFVK